LLGITPERSIVLLEDIDAAFNRRVQTSEDGYKSAVTFSGLLNALDGVASAEERIIFMTTNHFDKLDPALVRPGRVDVKELLDDATPEQVERLFNRFYGKESAQDSNEVQELARDLGDIVGAELKAGRRVSMAALQGHFIRHGPAECLSNIRELFSAKRSTATML
jgi:chaperone BCS1